MRPAGLFLDGEEWWPVGVAANWIRLTPAAVYKSIERGRIRERRVFDRVFVPVSDVEKLWPERGDDAEQVA